MVDRTQDGKASPTERTLAYVSARGYTPYVCEARMPAGYGTIAKDFLGFGDIWMTPGNIVIQTTNSANHANRKTKILTERRQEAWDWLQDGRIVVLSWKRYVKPVDGLHWRPIISEITPAMLIERGFVPPPPKILLPLEANDGNSGHCAARARDVAADGGRESGAPCAPRRKRKAATGRDRLDP